MDNKIWTAIGIVAIIAIAGAVVWASLPESEDDDRPAVYHYTVDDVYRTSVGFELLTCTFDEEIEAGMVLTVRCDGMVLGESEIKLGGGHSPSITLSDLHGLDRDYIQVHAVVEIDGYETVRTN